MKMNVLSAVALVAIGSASCAFGAVEDPVEFIRGEIAAGKREIKVPKARYTLTPKEGETCYLELKGLNGVTIDFSGSELVVSDDYKVRDPLLARILHLCLERSSRHIGLTADTLKS